MLTGCAPKTCRELSLEVTEHFRAHRCVQHIVFECDRLGGAGIAYVDTLGSLTKKDLNACLPGLNEAMGVNIAEFNKLPRVICTLCARGLNSQGRNKGEPPVLTLHGTARRNQVCAV